MITFAIRMVFSAVVVVYVFTTTETRFLCVLLMLFGEVVGFAFRLLRLRIEALETLVHFREQP